MIGYCSFEDVTTRFTEKEIVQLTTQTSTDHQTENTRLTSAIEGAEAEINLWLSRCYVLPLIPPFPLIIREWAILISRYKLYTQIRLVRGAAGVEDHQSRRDYTDCFKAMQEVCKMQLMYPDGALVAKLDDGPNFRVAERGPSPCGCEMGCCGCSGGCGHTGCTPNPQIDIRARSYSRI